MDANGDPSKHDDNGPPKQWPPRTLDQERDFIENLVSARFNWFMLLFGVILVYGYTAPDLPKRCVILAYGCVAASAIAIGTHRAQVKLKSIIKDLHATPEHPVKLSGEKAASESYGSVRAMWLIGSLVPLGCSICLLFLTGVSCIRAGWETPFECVGALVAFLSLVGWYRWMRKTNQY